MIQPNELRIGNWVYSKTYAKPMQFKSFFGLCNVESDTDSFEPIPLTPEVLDKCGFFEYISYYLKSGVRITKFLQHGGVDFAYTGDSIYTEIKYLHQLQNLYFALTGEELEYKP